MDLPLEDGETARPVPGYEGDYYVTDHNRVFSTKHGEPRQLSPYSSPRRVDLFRGGTRAKPLVRTIRRQAFGVEPDSGAVLSDEDRDLVWYLDQQYELTNSEVADILDVEPETVEAVLS